jgi:hypothetical protein
MNVRPLLVASLLTLASAALCPAQQAASPGVISVGRIDTSNPQVYATLIARNNEVIKAKHGVSPYVRVFVGDAAGTDSGVAYAVIAADNFAGLAKLTAAVMADPALMPARTELNAVRELGPRTLYQVVRWEGDYPKAELYNTMMTTADEAGYLKALDKLRTLCDANGLKDVRINVFRAVAGRTDHTHIVSFSAPSKDRIAALLDGIGGGAWVRDWLAGVAAMRTVARNGTYSEVVR